MKNRLPVWFKQELPSRQAREFSGLLRDKFRLNTVCHSAKCPNATWCFSQRHATFLIMGNRCTRNCRFCNIEQEKNLLPSLDKDEPQRIAQAVKFLNLQYVVVTSVTRDDLADGGSGHFAKTIQAIKTLNPDISVEVLIPDFQGSNSALEIIIKQRPDVIAHNLETVKRIFPLVRHQADYKRSLDVLENIKLINSSQITKSSIMLGLGELDMDLEESLADLRLVKCDKLVLGQYLRPSPEQYPVEKFYSPEEFKYWEKFAYGLGFKSVCAFPLARTSYLANKNLAEKVLA
ncbi:MAG: lipoyl synthase [Candidatus Omnitrophica bacterium]|nr:lipoyl synthase [Candidatus Omnitrophota bacterium]MDD5352119.1 lipoyl synthase [Candidatus Omnitrophota bacterium]MDD5549717.1 lipoyl synthase [Candidatus Omnitrophota bacterium]